MGEGGGEGGLDRLSDEGGAAESLKQEVPDR